MKQDRYLQRLVRRAREEPPPRVNVTDKVMMRLRSETAERWSFRALWWFAAWSAIAAAVTVLLVVQAWRLVANPLLELAYSLTWGMI